MVPVANNNAIPIRNTPPLMPPITSLPRRLRRGIAGGTGNVGARGTAGTSNVVGSPWRPLTGGTLGAKVGRGALASAPWPSVRPQFTQYAANAGFTVPHAAQRGPP